MSIQSKEFTEFIKLLDNSGSLPYVILVGSWTEYIYKETRLLKDFTPNVKTLDIDFLLKNLKKPKESINLMGIAKQEGYLVETDILTNTTKIYDKKGLEIEFLINKVGAGAEDALKTNLGVTAQSLRHMNIILKNTVVVDFKNTNLTVPLPEAYVIHKMVINDERGNKQEKDKNAVINLLPFLNRNKYNEIYETLTKTEKRKVDKFLELYVD